MPAVDYYEVLGVGRKARPAEIKKAYKRLARKCHPDLNPGNRTAEEQFKRITEAYAVLSDPEKRRRYDQGGLGAEGSPFQGAGGAGPGVPPDFGAAGFGGGFSDIFAEIFGEGPAPREREPRTGGDRVYPMRIGFFDALRGLTTTIQIEGEEACPVCAGLGVVASSRARVCPDCHGTGKVERFGGRIRFTPTCRRCGGSGRLMEETCSRCSGSGKISRVQKLQVQIPPGVDTGSRVRIAGKGGAGVLGGPPGDLYILIQVDSHPFFSRAGDQILCTVPVTFSEAALGSKVEVPTVDGPATIRIPPGTQSGQKLRLRGRGAPSLRGGARGDQIVEVKVVTPDVRDEKAKTLLRQLAELDRTDLRSHLGTRS
ncbi:MAG TPA: molecular chaperone DnaJ [Candidatus Polarisedimenticolia bacterium]|jgi:molecular chaperone DnaJ|nr:molecular chaperone DnaJ [Candidatus Polarisedimenticolia bacterium]